MANMAENLDDAQLGSKEDVTIVFFAVSTVGFLANYDPVNTTKLTSLCLMQTSKKQLARRSRLVKKWTFFFNPETDSHSEAIMKSGLTDEYLKKFPTFGQQARQITQVLRDLPKPTLLVAHQGFRFHFKYLFLQLANLDDNFIGNLGEIYCADSLQAFQKHCPRLEKNNLVWLHDYFVKQPIQNELDEKPGQNIEGRIAKQGAKNQKPENGAEDQNLKQDGEDKKSEKDVEKQKAKQETKEQEFEQDEEEQEPKQDAKGQEFNQDVEEQKPNIDANGQEFKQDVEEQKPNIDANGQEFKQDVEEQKPNIDANGQEFKQDVEEQKPEQITKYQVQDARDQEPYKYAEKQDAEDSCQMLLDIFTSGKFEPKQLEMFFEFFQNNRRSLGEYYAYLPSVLQNFLNKKGESKKNTV